MTKSKIFLYFCLSFIIGIGLSSFLIIPVNIAGIILVVGISLIIVWWRCNSRLVVLGFCAILAALGAYRYSVSLGQNFGAEVNNLSLYNNYSESVLISGIISGEPDERSSNIKYEVKSQGVDINGVENKVDGKFLVTINKYPSYHYGDLVEFSGKLKTPKDFSDFSYKDYLARYDIYSTMDYPQSRLVKERQGNLMYAGILSAKKLFQRNINGILPEPHSSFLSGLLLGTKKQIPAKLLEDFNKTGTTHIVAISGYNITIIAFLIVGFLTFLGIHRYWAFWFSVAGIMLFTVLTGASASVVRAAIMGILVLAANRLGRLSRATNALVFSGTIMLLINPKLLRFDIGFELSFLATMGLIFFSGIIENRIDVITTKVSTSIQGIKLIKDSLATTLAAQIFVLPVIAYNFGQISLISPLANVLILPAIPITMLVGFIGGVVGLIWLLPAKLIGYLAWALLSYEIKVVEILGFIPLSSITIGKFSWVWVAGYYVIIVILYYRLKSRNKKQLVLFSV